MQMQFPDTTITVPAPDHSEIRPGRCNPSSDNLASPARNSSRETTNANRRGSHEPERRNTLRYSALRGLGIRVVRLQLRIGEQSTGNRAASGALIAVYLDRCGSCLSASARAHRKVAASWTPAKTKPAKEMAKPARDNVLCARSARSLSRASINARRVSRIDDG